MKHVKLVGAVVSHCDYIKYTAVEHSVFFCLYLSVLYKYFCVLQLHNQGCQFTGTRISVCGHFMQWFTSFTLCCTFL